MVAGWPCSASGSGAAARGLWFTSATFVPEPDLSGSGLLRSRSSFRKLSLRHGQQWSTSGTRPDRTYLSHLLPALRHIGSHQGRADGRSERGG
jgi:hypothetical protein